MAASAGSFGPGLLDGAGLVSIVLLSLASAVVTVVRRRRSRARLLATVLARLPASGSRPAKDGPAPAAEPL